uniref:Cytochrome P450 n=1 Tax=Timema poppense TaxID=170557 RepID=A0A7R9CUM2_TIMPO|nr:unnamed protein product [Timema poppensis]
MARTRKRIVVRLHYVETTDTNYNTYLRNTIPIKEITAGYTIDVLASCAFGVNANAIVDRKAEFHEILRQIFELKTIDLIKTTVAFFLPWSVKYLKLKLTNDHVDDFVRKTLWDVVAHREKTGLVREDFVHLLMKLRKGREVQEETKNDATEVADQQDSTDMTNKINVLDFSKYHDYINYCLRGGITKVISRCKS